MPWPPPQVELLQQAESAWRVSELELARANLDKDLEALSSVNNDILQVPNLLSERAVSAFCCPPRFPDAPLLFNGAPCEISA